MNPTGAALWGLATMLATALLTPGLGAWADQTDRCHVVTLGVLAQANGDVAVVFLESWD